MILAGSALAVVNYVVAALIDILGLEEHGQALDQAGER
jgi:hypothetical protein